MSFLFQAPPEASRNLKKYGFKSNKYIIFSSNDSIDFVDTVIVIETCSLPRIFFAR